MLGMRKVGVLVTLLSGLILGTGASECPSDKWELDEESDRCLWLSKTGLDYDSALEDCRRRGGHLTTPDKIENIEILEKSFGLKEEPVSFWAEYLLVLHGSRHRLFDGSGAEVELSSCGQCQSLLDQHSQVRNQSVTRVCAHVTRNTSTTWTTTDCQNEHSFVCYHSRNSEQQSLAPRDIAAIAVGAFILLSFFVTLAIDFYLHVKREKRKYVESTKPNLDHKKASPLDFSVTNFGSKAELIPTNASSSHV